MADCRFPSTPKDCVCIETNRILDSCCDRDCFENVRVYLTGFGNDIIARTGAVRARDAEIVWTSIGVDPIQFNRGFYSVSVRYYIRLVFEACVGKGRAQEFDGMAVVDKNVILYGGESSVSVFRSTPGDSGFCSLPEPGRCQRNCPVAVTEVVDPVVLGVKVTDEKSCVCFCACNDADIPSSVTSCLSAELCPDSSERVLSVSLGIFSVIRLVRTSQFVINASEYSVPDKECFEPCENDPCSVFRKMAFPVGEFGVSANPNAACPCSCGTPDKIDRPPIDKRCGC